jgi:alkylglycerol monooxygenase
MSEIFWSGITLNASAFVLPAFFIFTGLELIAARQRRQPHLFSFESSVANMSIGIAERLLSLFLRASFYNVFMFIFTNFAIWDIPNHWIVWVVLILVTDLVWYWYHRLGHEVNLLWAAHIVHHQSEEFNYTVAARITVLQAIVRNAFWCILPLAGFHPNMVMTTLLVHGTYSFFTHTQIIRKLGWLEYILVTPSHHRVHHASNEKYLNKNYGDLFIFWDKLFGTFEKEEEAPTYGLTHPLKSRSFIWQHIHYFAELIYAVRITPGILNKLKTIFGKPEYLDQRIRVKLERMYLSRNASSSSSRHKNYVATQLIISALLSFAIILFYPELSLPETFAGSLLILITLINCGALLEQRQWIHYLELARLLIIICYASYFFQSPYLLIGSALVIPPSFHALKKWYFRKVYDPVA